MPNPYEPTNPDPEITSGGTRSALFDAWIGIFAIIFFVMYFAIFLHILVNEGRAHAIWEWLVLPVGIACLAACATGFLSGIKRKKQLMPLLLAFISLPILIHLSMLLFPQWH